MNAQTDNWTTSVSQYLINRRQQTKKAYNLASIQSASINSKQVADTLPALFNTHRNSLFESFFYILGNELTGGHTVIGFKADSSEFTKPEIETPAQNIFGWQVDILERLLIRWQESIDLETDLQSVDLIQILSYYHQILNDKKYFEIFSHHHSHDNDKNGHSEILKLPHTSPFKQVINNGNLNSHQQNGLINQLKLAIEMYHFFSIFNQLSDGNNGLQEFFNGLGQLPLFVNTGLSGLTTSIASDGQYSNQHAPIVINFTNSSNGSFDNNNNNEHCDQLTCWIHRSWQAEQSILDNIERLNQVKPSALDLSKINQKKLNSEQLSAIHIANNSAFSIITGGPGTGKTYTVAQLVIAIHHANANANSIPQSKQSKQTQQQPPLNIVLSAPTGKAAQRMQESLSAALADSGIDMTLQKSKTIHRLLGIGTSGTPKYTIDNPLAEDIIIVDEASMLGVELANDLLSAVKTGARLILLGDSHQLSAVDAGAVLSDLCQIDSLKSVHIHLIESRRFTDTSAIGKLAKLINNPHQNGDDIPDNNVDEITQKVTALIESHDDIVLYQADSKQSEKQASNQVYKQLADNYQAYFDESLKYLQPETINALPAFMNVFNKFRILTSGHHGSYGDDTINQMMTQVHRTLLKMPTTDFVTNASMSKMSCYHGRPIMVQKNNYDLTLFNGDIGLCIETVDGLAVYFEGKDKPISLDRLGNLEAKTAYAITVHKSQGSEFDHVAVMLGNSFNMNSDNQQNQHLINREMLYTSVTRAKQKVSLYALLPTITFAMMNPTMRQTGLGISH